MEWQDCRTNQIFVCSSILSSYLSNMRWRCRRRRLIFVSLSLLILSVFSSVYSKCQLVNDCDFSYLPFKCKSLRKNAARSSYPVSCSSVWHIYCSRSIPLMLHLWHYWRYVIVGQMADYTNPHYSSWCGWDLDHINRVFHFFICSHCVKWVLIICVHIVLLPLTVPSFLSHFLFFPKLLMERGRWDSRGTD